MVNLLNLDYTIEQSELVNGDIIVFQKNESFMYKNIFLESYFF